MLEMDFIRLLFSQKSGKTFFPIQVRCLIRTLYLSYFRKKLHLRCLKPISFMNYFRKKHHLRCLTRIQSNTYFCEKLQLRCLTRLHPFTVFVCVFVCACVCVCVCVFFHREGFFRLQNAQDIIEGTDQQSCVVNIS